MTASTRLYLHLPQQNSDEAASASATWLIPLLLVALLVGLTIAGLKLSPFKRYWTRALRYLRSFKQSRLDLRPSLAKFDIAEEEKWIATPDTELRFVFPDTKTVESSILVGPLPIHPRANPDS